MPAPALIMQTTYAELLDRCRATAFQDTFFEDGSFVAKTIKGKRYWYFQQNSDEGREQNVLWSQLQKDSGERRFAEAVDEREASTEAVW